MSASTEFDTTIPVLTEVIANNDPPTLDTPMDPTPAPSLDQIEKSLHETILRELTKRIDFVLEHRIKDGVAEALDKAIDRLTNDIRKGLHTSLDDAIQRAISQEISKIK
jgi:hypothetical protein